MEPISMSVEKVVGWYLVHHNGGQEAYSRAFPTWEKACKYMLETLNPPQQAK